MFFGGRSTASLWGWRAAAGALFIAHGVTVVALAQVPMSPFSSAFQELLADLKSPEKSFRYAQMAIQSGATGEAVSALERVLLLNPGLDNIRLELGYLYYRLGSLALAHTNIEQALRSPDVPPDVRARGERLLADIDKASGRHRWNVAASFGVRYDSNVNFEPNTPEVLVFGSLFQLDGTSTAAPDGSIVSTAGLTYTYDLGWQDDSAIEVNFQGYDQRYFERSEFDLGIYQLDVGPRFRLDGALSALSVRPYVAGALLTLEELRYLTQGAAGLNIRHDISSTYGLEYYGQAGHRHYTNSDRRTTASDSSGAEYQGGVTMRARVDDNQLASLLLRGTRTNAEKRSQSQLIIQFGGSYAVDLGSAMTPMERPVVVTFSGLYSSVHYDAADPTIDPTIRRHDHRLDGRLITSVGLTDWLSFVFTGEMTRNYSSLPNFQYNNSGVSASFAASF